MTKSYLDVLLSKGQNQTLYTYNENNQVVEAIIINSDNEAVVRRNVYKYNPQNDLVQEIEYNPENKPNLDYKYEYLYDEQGNWIQKIVFREETPKLIIERIITYY